MIHDIKESAIFLFAHQDDETAVFQKILDEVALGRRVICGFLTTGMPKGLVSSRRNNESISVLIKFGIKRHDIHFVGDQVGIADGELINRTYQAAIWLEQFLFERDSNCHIYVPAWEGGHPDHDILHAITVLLAQKYDRLNMVRQYSLYNGYQCKGPLFRTFLPLPENGVVEKVKVNWCNRFRFLGYCLQYPSQLKTWIGLFPMMLLHYMIWGTQNIQIVAAKRILERPHSGLLYYERRKFSTYQKVNSKIIDLIESVKRI